MLTSPLFACPSACLLTYQTHGIQLLFLLFCFVLFFFFFLFAPLLLCSFPPYPYQPHWLDAVTGTKLAKLFFFPLMRLYPTAESPYMKAELFLGWLSFCDSPVVHLPVLTFALSFHSSPSPCTRECLSVATHTRTFGCSPTPPNEKTSFR